MKKVIKVRTLRIKSSYSNDHLTTKKMKKSNLCIIILGAVWCILLCSMALPSSVSDDKPIPSLQPSSGFVASYDFLPTQNRHQTQSLSNNIDRINQVQNLSSGSSTSTSLWQLALFCTGSGSGQTFFYDDPYYDVCGTSEYFPDQSLLYYAFVPDQGSQLTHLYVNNVDRINQVQHLSSGSSSSYSLWSFVLTNDVLVNPVFDQSSSPSTFAINITPNFPTRGYTSGSGIYNYLDTVTAQATPYVGFYFAGWSNGINDNPYTFAATQDLDLQAIFLLNVGINQVDEQEFSVTTSGLKITVGNVQHHPVRIYDIRGCLIFSETQTGESVSVDVPEGGIYIVMVEGQPTRKVLVH